MIIIHYVKILIINFLKCLFFINIKQIHSGIYIEHSRKLCTYNTNMRHIKEMSHRIIDPIITLIFLGIKLEHCT